MMYGFDVDPLIWWLWSSIIMYVIIVVVGIFLVAYYEEESTKDGDVTDAIMNILFGGLVAATVLGPVWPIAIAICIFVGCLCLVGHYGYKLAKHIVFMTKKKGDRNVN